MISWHRVRKYLCQTTQPAGDNTLMEFLLAFLFQQKHVISVYI